MRFAIDKTPTGYRMILVTTSGDAFRALTDDQVHAQLSFVPKGEIDRAYLNGTYLGRTDDNERIFEFLLESRFDVDDEDQLQLTSFRMYDLENRATGVPLDGVLDLQYIVSNYDIDGLEATTLDTVKGQFLLPEDNTVVIQEALKVRFGTALGGLWARSRSVVSSMEYVRYQSDVLATYAATVYQRDPQTGAIALTRDPETGEILYEVLHAQGEAVLDSDGVQVLRYRQGDIKRDNEGNPLPESGRKILRQVELLLLEGSFTLATDRRVLNYARDTARAIVNWVSTDIAAIQERMLENTQLWYYPQTTLGTVRALVEDGLSTAVSADQSFRVKYYLTKIGYDNVDLRAELSRTAVVLINQTLDDATISVSAMARRIKDQVSSEVLDVVVSGLGGEANYEMLSLEDDSSRLGIRKRLDVLPNGELTVQDDVSVEFIRHRA